MQLTKWVHEPLWISNVKVIRWLWSKVTQLHIFKPLFLRNARRIEAKFHVKPPWDGEWKFVQTVQVTWPIWPSCPYIVKNLKKKPSLEPNNWWLWKLVCSIKYWNTTKFAQMMTLGDLDLFYGKGKFDPLYFCMGKGLNNGFFRNYCSLWYQSWWIQSTK